MRRFLNTKLTAFIIPISLLALILAAGCQAAPGSAGPQGPEGSQGIQGPAGSEGAQGPEGDRGDAGPKGDTGIAGKSGAQGPAAPQSAAAITLDPMVGEAPRPTFTIYGSGFAPNEAVLAEIVVGLEELPETIVGGAVANAAGAFSVLAEMPKGYGPTLTIDPGMYTVQVTGSEGSIASAPLSVVEAK